jgi:hypothetical protein
MMVAAAALMVRKPAAATARNANHPISRRFEANMSVPIAPPINMTIA